MEISSSQATYQPSFKQLLIQDNRDPRSYTQDILIGGAFVHEVNPSNLDIPLVSYAFTEDNVPIMTPIFSQTA